MAGTEEIARLLIRLQADSGQMKTDLNKATAEINAFATTAKKILAGIGITFGLKILANEIKEVVAWAHAYNSEIEQSQIGIAAIVNATSEIKDATGKTLEGEEKWLAALEIGAEMHERILSAAMRTSATTAEIVQGFQAMLGPARSAGLSLEQTLSLATSITQAMQSMNLPMVQFRIEANALIKGEESVRADLMKNLQIRGEEVKQAQELGKLYEFLDEKLKTFARSGEAQLTTWKGLKSSMEDIVSVLGAAAEKPLFVAATKALGDLVGLLTEGTEGTIKFSDSATNAAKQIGAAFETIVGHFRVFSTEYGALVYLLTVSLQTLNILVVSLFMGLSVAFWQFFGFLTAAVMVLDKLSGWGLIPGFSASVKAMEAEFKRMGEEIEKQAFSAAGAWGALAPILMGVAEATGDVKLMMAANRLTDKDVVSPEAMEKAKDSIEKIVKKVEELKIQQTELVNPVAASRAALELWIATTTKGAATTPELAARIEELREQFTKLEEMKEAKFRIEAVDKSALKASAEGVKTELATIKAAYETGQMDLDVYFARRRAAITEGAQAEIRILNRELSRAPTETEKITIRSEISGKEADLKGQMIVLDGEQTEAVLRLNQAVRDGEAAEIYQRTETELQLIQARYEQGMVTIQEYYEIKRVSAEDVGTKEIDNLETALAVAGSQAEKQEIITKLMERKAELQREITGLTIEETNALKNQAFQLIEINSMLAALKERASPGLGPIGNMRAAFATQLVEMDGMHAQELQKIRDLNEEKIKIGEEYYSKTELLEKTQSLQTQERAQRGADFEIQVLQTRLQLTGQVVGEMGNMFGQLYEMSGKKAKGFFYAQKAMAIASAIINTAEAITKALAQGGLYATLMVPAIAAMGAAQVGIIASTMISGPGAKEGGLITRGRTNEADDVPIRVSRREFIQPRQTVEYYGVEAMEALRRRLIPRELLLGFHGLDVKSPMSAYFQEGGLTTDVQQGGHTFNTSVEIPSFLPDGAKMAAVLQDEIEETVLRVVKRYS